MKNQLTLRLFKEVKNQLRQKNIYLITSHSFKSEDENGQMVKTKGPGRLSFQQYIQNNYLENVTITGGTKFVFRKADQKNFEQLKDSLEVTPMITAMQYIKDDLAKHSSSNDSQDIYKRFLIKKKKNSLTTLVYSVLFSRFDEGIVVLYFDEINKQDVVHDWGFPYQDIMFAETVTS